MRGDGGRREVHESVDKGLVDSADVVAGGERNVMVQVCWQSETSQQRAAARNSFIAAQTQHSFRQELS